MAWGTDLGTTYANATDATARPSRLAPVENAVKARVDLITTTLGDQVALLGGYATVKDRLAALTVDAAGMTLPVRVKSYGNVTLATAVENGDTIDGVVLATGDRILLDGQTAQAENGVYTVNATGAPTRAADWAAGADFPGRSVTVTSGTRNAGTVWRCTNSSAPTLGTTAVTFAKLDRSTLHLKIAASNAQAHERRAADLICDGVSDEIEFTVAAYIALAGAAPGVRIEASSGDFTFAAAFAALQDHTTISGQGARTTDFTNSASAIVFDLSGPDSATHRLWCGLDRLRIRNTTGTTQPAVRSYYSTEFRAWDVEWGACAGGAFEGLEMWDWHFTRCEWVDCGTQGVSEYDPTGALAGRPALLFLGATAAAGWGSTNDNVNSGRITDCLLHSWVDGGIVFQGNGAAEFVAGTAESFPNKIYISNTKCETAKAGYGPALRFYKTRCIGITQLDVTIGANFAGGATAHDYVEFAQCHGVRWYGANLERSSSDNNTRSFVLIDGGSSFDLNGFMVQINGTVAPTAGVISYATSLGTPTKIHREGCAIWNDGSGATVMEHNYTVVVGRYKNNGTDTIAAAATSVTVTHKMHRTPAGGEIMLTMGESPTNDVRYVWLSAVGATTFQINCQAVPGASALDVHWSADCPMPV